MLIVGMSKHGFGAWPEIRSDTKLGMGDKLFLEEHRVAAKEDRTKGGEAVAPRSPGAVHLVRRANYLLSVLKDKLSNGTNQAAKKALENHHRNNRKHLGQFHGRFSTPNATSASPAPNKRMHSSDVRNSIDHRTGHGSPNGHRKVSSDRVKRRRSEDRKPQHSRHANSPGTNGKPEDESTVRVR